MDKKLIMKLNRYQKKKLKVQKSNLASGLERHIHPNIQHDMELWQRVREYDQHATEVPFTPVLSKKQKQNLKKGPGYW